MSSGGPATLRFLAGGNYIDIVDLYQLPPTCPFIFLENSSCKRAQLWLLMELSLKQEGNIAANRNRKGYSGMVALSAVDV
jgi:hypothetical protein